MNYKKIVKSNLFVFILFLLIFYAIFRYSESFTKGYNIVEDFYVITTSNSLESLSYPTVFGDLMNTELYGIKRFRPVWVLYFLTSVKLFGFDLLLLNLYVFFLCTCTCFLLFKFCRYLSFSYLQAFLFALLSLIGPATIMYTRPPDAEIIGMLMLSISLFFLSRSIYDKNHQLFYKVGFIFFLLITSLCKESFLILTPAILFLYLIVYSSKNGTGIIQSIKKNYLILITSTLFSVIVLTIIFKLIGINQDRSYSGVNVDLFSVKVISDFIYTIFKTDMFLLVLFGIFIFFDNELQRYKLSSKYIKKHINTLFTIIVFTLITIIPQFILYYKTGFAERYYLPYLIGYSFLLVYILKTIFDSKSISSFIKYLYLSTIIVYLFLELSTKVIPAISIFSDECNATTELANFIKDSSDDKLLIVLDPAQNYHKVYSLKIYLDYLNIKKDYNYDFIKSEVNNKFYSDTSFYNKQFQFAKSNLGEDLINPEKENGDLNTILLFKGLNSSFIEKNKNWFKEGNYKKIQNFFYTIYYK